MTTVCTQCGFNNPPGMRYCGNCGTRMEQVAPTSVGVPLAPPASLAEIGVMIGADLEERLRRAGIEASGQRRNVTVLFTDISGFTALSQVLDGEDLFDLVQQFIGVLSEDVYKYEGIVDKLTGDGLMALFGAPISHENNAERAVRAALDMQKDLRQLSRRLHEDMGVDVNVRIGLHSGSVVVGGISTNLMMDYTAIGDTVNLAQRIEDATPPGAILVSETVYRAVRALFDCQQISILNLKGIVQPVVAYRVLALKSRPGAVRGVEGLYAPMIGRDRELVRLKGAAADLIENQRGQFALITGEAGLGKSRLTAEFKASLDLSAVRILEAHSLAYRRVSYWIIRELLYSYLGIPSSTQPLQTREILARALYASMEAQAGQVLPLIEHLLSLPYSDPATAERLPRLDAGQLRQQIFLAVRDLLVASAGERPLVIILDDLHWADEASLELVLFLLEALSQSPIFILANTRYIGPGSLERALTWAQKNLGEGFHNIHLQSLSLDQSKQLLHLLLTIPNLPEKLRQQILQRAAGIPFYLEEILRMLIDQGVIKNQDGRWQVLPGMDIGTMGVPDSLQELILARFDRLEGPARRVLQVASIIGKDFSLSVLSAVLRPAEPQELHTTIDLLVDRAFIQPQAGSLGTEFTFRHILMSDAIYSTILRKERSRIHGVVADTIETMYASRLEEQVELLANHYRWSPRLDKALHYLILAGQKAARNHVNEQARQQYEAALELLPQVASTSQQAFQVYSGLGDVSVFFGEYPEARRFYQQALQSLQGQDEAANAGQRSFLFRMIARTFERQGDYDQALVHLSMTQQALMAVPGTYPVETAQVWSDIAWIHFRRGAFHDAQGLLEEALELVVASDASDVIASIYNRLGGVAYNQGDSQQTARCLRRSIAIRESIQDIVGLATSLNNLGLLEIEMGEFDSALKDLKQSYELKARLGQPEGVAMALNNMGWLHIQRGELSQAQQTLDEALGLARQIGYSSLYREILKNIGELHLASQEWEQAIQVLQENARALTEMGANDQLVDTYRQLGEAAFGAGDLSAARTWGRQAQELSQEIKGQTGELSALQRGELLRFLGMLATKEGDWEAASRYLNDSQALFQTLRIWFYQARAVFQLGVLAEAQGDQASAYEHYGQAAALFHSVGAQLEAQRVENAAALLQQLSPIISK